MFKLLKHLNKLEKGKGGNKNIWYKELSSILKPPIENFNVPWF